MTVLSYSLSECRDLLGTGGKRRTLYLMLTTAKLCICVFLSLSLFYITSVPPASLGSCAKKEEADMQTTCDAQKCPVSDQKVSLVFYTPIAQCVSIKFSKRSNDCGDVLTKFY